MTTDSSISKHDVLLGRGGQTNNHVGNQEFRKVVAEHQNEYLQARKKEKILIARRVVAVVQGRGGRFLKRSPDGDSWVPVPDKRAQEKTSQALREGLDVRNSTIREPKSTNKRGSDDVASVGSSNEQPRKRTKVVQGKVSSPSVETQNSPSVVSQQGDVHSIPALNNEVNNQIPSIPPSLLQYQRQISKGEVLNEVSV